MLTRTVSSANGERDGLPPHDLLPDDRRQYILQQLDHNGSVRNTWLADQLGVTPITIRRDLRTLAAEGLLRLVHGGATIGLARVPLTADEDLVTKRAENTSAKQRVADKALTLINSGDIIALNSGSTVEIIASSLPTTITDLTVATMALNVATTMARHSGSTLILAGGMLRPGSQAFVGPEAVRLLSSLRIDLGFFGATAVDVEAGWTHPDSVEVETNKALFEVSTKRYLVADSTKFGRSAIWHIADLDAFDALIVDDDVDPTVLRWAAQAGVEVI